MWVAFQTSRLVNNYNYNEQLGSRVPLDIRFLVSLQQPEQLYFTKPTLVPRGPR